jgi:uracil-DNA glycosylase
VQAVLSPREILVNDRLRALFARLESCDRCATAARGYRHVPGGGCVDRPRLMLVFINPTFRNLSARADWPGPAFPFAATPRLWHILAEAGLVSRDLPAAIAALGPSPALVDRLMAESRRSGIYLTNAVKCVDLGSNLPAAERVAASWPLLAEEIAIVRPRHIVALGQIPLRALTGRTVRLADHLWDAQHGGLTPLPSRSIDGRVYPVFACYFPTGRGNPVAATTMLRAINAQVMTHAADQHEPA